MINLKLIYKVIGSLLFIEAFMMLLCFAMAVYFAEDDVIALAVSIVVTIGCGLWLRRLGRRADNVMGRRDAYLVVTLLWMVFSLFGALPFLISGYIPDFTNAYFESMSGFSTTGATVIDDIDALPHGLLFWRTMTQWIGGLGIVFFTIAVLPSLVGGSVRVFSAEATGPIKAKMHPKLSTTAKWIWTIYTLLTAGCVVVFFLLGMGWFDALNYGMTITATGGFAPHNDSTMFFGSRAINYAAIVFMFLAGTSFTLLYTSIFKGRVREFARNTEFRFYASVIVCCTLLLMLILIISNGYGLLDALHSSLYQVVAFTTTTGIVNDDIGRWPLVTWLLLTACMFIGGCAGSTAGGLKCIRAVMLLRILQNELRRMLHPRAVLPVKVNGQSILYAQQVSVAAFFALYVLMCFFTYLVFVLLGIDNMNAMTIAFSLATNAGASLSMGIGDVMSWNDLPVLGKWLCTVLMLMGRIEIFSVLILFTPSFWKDH